MTDNEKDKKNKSTLNEDLFENLEDLRIDQNFSESIGVKKHIKTIPVRKPHRQDFIRVHDDESYHLQTAILEIKEDRENYLVTPSLWKELPNEITPKMLYTAINRQGVPFLWPVRLPDETGRLDEWNRSAHKAAQMAMEGWIRLASNLSLGAYEIFEPTGNLPDPEWPDIEFNEILKIAFRDKIIDDTNHPVLKQLRGEM
jgi:hypothetical protein